MNEAPRDGRWILVRVRFCDEFDQHHDIVTAAQFVAVHGGFCGLAIGGGIGQVQSPLSPYSWMPQLNLR